MFVVIEGLDGAGTTTQVERLVAYLTGAGRRVVQTFEPSTGPLGRMCRATLAADPEAPPREVLPWMYAGDRAHHLVSKVEPTLAAGDVVVSDRYVPSSLAYQSLTHPMEFVWQLNAGFRAPELTVFVEVDVETALERIHARARTLDIYENREQLQRVHLAYEQALSFVEAQGYRVVRVDGTASMDAVHEAIVAAVEA